MSNESAKALVTQAPLASIKAPLAVATPTPTQQQAPVTATAEPTPNQDPPSTPPVEDAKLDNARLAHIAKKEQEFFKSREALKAEKAQFETERTKLLDAQKRLSDFEQLKQKDAIAAMKFAGFTDTDILNYFASLEDKSTPEEKAAKVVQEELQKFKSEMAEKETKQFESKISEDVTFFKASAQEVLTSDKDKYEYCNHYGPLSEELILATAAEVVKQEGAPKSREDFAKLAKEVADLVEGYYESQDKAMSQLKKRTTKQEPTPEPVATNLSPGISQPAEPVSHKFMTKTLSNKAVATTAAAAAAASSRKETPSEKRQRLMNMLANMGKTPS